MPSSVGQSPSAASSSRGSGRRASVAAPRGTLNPDEPHAARQPAGSVLQVLDQFLARRDDHVLGRFAQGYVDQRMPPLRSRETGPPPAREPDQTAPARRAGLGQHVADARAGPP